MARKKGVDSWVKVVIGLTIFGFMALGSLAVYYVIKNRQNQQPAPVELPLKKSKKQKKYMAYRPSLKPLRQHKTYEYLDTLREEADVPLEIVHHRSHYIRPKKRLQHLNTRAKRVEKNLALLRKTQHQEKELDDLEQRLTSLEQLEKIDTLY